MKRGQCPGCHRAAQEPASIQTYELLTPGRGQLLMQMVWCALHEMESPRHAWGHCEACVLACLLQEAAHMQWCSCMQLCAYVARHQSTLGSSCCMQKQQQPQQHKGR